MVSKINKNAMRLKRHVRVRGKISGTPECPRLNVFRSNANIYAQIIDDVNGVTLVSANTLEKNFEVLPAMPRLPRRLACWLLNVHWLRALRKSCSTAAAMFTTAVSLPWLKAPAKAA